MLCEVSVDDTASYVSNVIDNETFNELLKTDREILFTFENSSSSSDSESDNELPAAAKNLSIQNYK